MERWEMDISFRKKHPTRTDDNKIPMETKEWECQSGFN